MTKKGVKELSNKVRSTSKVPIYWGIDDAPDVSFVDTPECNSEWDGYLDHKKQPHLVFYIRVSKASPTHSNLISQEKALRTLYSFFEPLHFYPDIDKPWLFEKDFIIRSDESKSGSKINSGLAELLDLVTFEDIILVQNISRLTRMDVRCTEFKELHQKLYSQGRLVYMLGPDNMPLQITKDVFLDFAKLSNEEYEELKLNSLKGNKIKSINKTKAMDLCAEYYNKHYSHKLIAVLIKRKVPTVNKYVAELRKQGRLTRFGRSKLAQRHSPVPFDTAGSDWEGSVNKELKKVINNTKTIRTRRVADRRERLFKFLKHNDIDWN